MQINVLKKFQNAKVVQSSAFMECDGNIELHVRRVIWLKVALEIMSLKRPLHVDGLDHLGGIA